MTLRTRGTAQSLRLAQRIIIGFVQPLDLREQYVAARSNACAYWRRTWLFTSRGCLGMDWTICSGVVIAIPESGNAAHVKENAVALSLALTSEELQALDGAVAGLVGIEGDVVSGVFNLESSDVRASDRRPRHDEHYHEA